MARKQAVDIEIDTLTNSIANIITCEVFETEFNTISKKFINKKDWLFNWELEFLDKQNEVYIMTTVKNNTIHSRIDFFKITR